mmetsp:Transcript_24254/g.38416  ORF Transcript_24254/g.38416 Transcript_24254/m.38416 type:complete len:99 (-) Transcript_24254:1251-1547(-)
MDRDRAHGGHLQASLPPGLPSEEAHSSSTQVLQNTVSPEEGGHWLSLSRDVQPGLRLMGRRTSANHNPLPRALAPNPSVCSGPVHNDESVHLVTALDR